MCFSLQASSISALVLTLIGIACLKKAYPHKALYPFAALPLIFGTQQTAEALVWYGFLNQNTNALNLGTFSYLFFALLWWPVWMPYSLYCLEEKPRRKQILFGFLCLGLVYALFVVIIGCCTVGAQMMDHHIVYSIPQLERYTMLWLMGYIATAIVPFFVASYYLFWIFGLAFTFALIASIFMFSGAVISIWCFFAALLSFLVWIIIRQLVPQHYL